MIHTKLSEIMTRDVITLSPNDDFNRVEKVFKAYSFHHIPIVDSDGKVVGMLSKSDYLTLCDSMTIFNRQHALEHNARFFGSLLTEDVMSKKVASLKESDTVKKAADYFRENLFHAIPIVNEDKKLVGMVTSLDLINFAYQVPV